MGGNISNRMRTLGQTFLTKESPLSSFDYAFIEMIFRKMHAPYIAIRPTLKPLSLSLTVSTALSHA